MTTSSSNNTPGKSADQAPASIGKYDIVSSLGSGAMGVVYKAVDPEIGRTVAIKTLRNIFLGDDTNSEAMQRFRQESRSAGKLRHPNIVTIFEAGRTETGTPYIVMEFIEGQSLEDFIREKAPADPAEALHLLGQIGSAIDYAHSQGVIHRDIKPSNVIIDSSGKPMLLDFGVAKLSDTSLTPAGMIVGTPSYMAPEQIKGETLDGGTDRFSFAVIAFEMLAGQRPFAGDDFTTVVSNIIHHAPFSFSQTKGAHLPGELEAVVHRGLSKVRDERYPTCCDFVSDMGKVYGVVADGAGLVGYRRGMKISELGSVPKKREPEQTMVNAPAFTGLSSNATAAEAPKKVVEAKGAPAKTPEKKSPPPSREVQSAPAAVEPWQQAKLESNRGSPVLWLLTLVLLGGAGVGGYYFSTSISGFLTGLFTADESSEESEGTDEVVSNEETPPQEPAVTVAQSTEAPSATEDSSAGEQNTGEAVVAATITPPRGDPALIAILEDPVSEPKQLSQAIQAAAKGESEIYLPRLLRLAEHPSYTVRVEVLKVLSADPKFKTAEVSTMILSKLNDPEFLVRGFSAKVIASLKNTSALPLLEKRLEVEENEVVKKVLRDSITKLNAELANPSS